MKTLKKLIDAKQLSKKEQQAIKGGSDEMQCWVLCPADYYCNRYNCYEYHPER